MDTLFDSLHHSLALSWLEDSTRLPEFSPVEFDRLSQWFESLGPNSSWRRDSTAYRILRGAVRIGQGTSSGALVFWEMSPSFMLTFPVMDVAASDAYDDLAVKELLKHEVVQAGVTSSGRRHVRFKYRSLRRIILRMLSFVDDEDSSVRESACGMIVCACRSSAEQETSKGFIASKLLDPAQTKLVGSADKLARGAGISLYAIRPPRSRSDWQRVRMLLQSTSAEECREYWTWVIRGAAEFPIEPQLWIDEITLILDAGVDDEVYVVMSDVLQDLLIRQSQSLSRVAVELDLQTKI